MKDTFLVECSCAVIPKDSGYTVVVLCSFHATQANHQEAIAFIRRLVYGEPSPSSHPPAAAPSSPAS